MEGLIKKKCLAGCDGCFYEDRDDCPAGNDYKHLDLSKCTDEDGFPIIFVTVEQENKG